MAHATSRATQDPLQKLTLWSGVVVALIAVVVGWWYTVGVSVRETLQSGSGDVRELTSELKEFHKQAEGNLIVNPPELPRPTNEAAAAEFSNMIEKILNDDGSSSTRTDLLSPYPVGAGTSTEATPSETETPLRESGNPFIDPETPGLIAE